MKAYLLNPHACTVTEVEHSGDYRHIYELCDYDTFRILTLEKRDCLYLDENGIHNNRHTNQGFGYRGWQEPLYGKALMLGTKRGKATAPLMTLENFRRHIYWVEQLSLPKVIQQSERGQEFWGIRPYGSERSEIVTRGVLESFLARPL